MFERCFADEADAAGPSWNSPFKPMAAGLGCFVGRELARASERLQAGARGLYGPVILGHHEPTPRRSRFPIDLEECTPIHFSILRSSHRHILAFPPIA